MQPKPPARVPLLWILLPLILGIALGRLLPIGPYYLLVVPSLTLGIFAWKASDRHPKRWARFLASSLLIAGYCYVNLADTQNKPRNNLPEREADLYVEIVRLFETYGEKQKGIGRIIATDTHLDDIQEAKIYFSLYSPPDAEFSDSIVAGSSIQVTGRLRPVSPNDTSTNSFLSYLANSDVAFQLDRGIILAVQPRANIWTNRFSAILSWANHSLSHGVDPDSPSTHAYTAMLLGMKSELNDVQKTLFLQNGALHLFAISGLHIGVIAACGHALFLLLRIPKPWIPIPNLLLIGLFVLSTGGAPSAWRALLMIACYYLCLGTKRQTASLNALVLSALICLLINPLQLFLAGFQMSYVTVLAIILYGVPLAERLNEYWNPFEHLPRKAWSFVHQSIHEIGRFLIGSFAVSLSAFLASCALSIIYFNTLPLIGILANIVLLPLASLTIISGFISLAFATIGADPIASLFNHAAQVVLWLMHAILSKLGSITGSHLVFTEPSAAILYLFLTALLIGMLWGYNRKWNIPKRYLWAFPILYPSICVIVALL
ncbi:MAG: hypothetical protein HN763_11795 [Opitutales bacterium]|nr:hypothetical protein [Opitutales bacterium]